MLALDILQKLHHVDDLIRVFPVIVICKDDTYTPVNARELARRALAENLLNLSGLILNAASLFVSNAHQPVSPAQGKRIRLGKWQPLEFQGKVLLVLEVRLQLVGQGFVRDDWRLFGQQGK